MILEPKIIGIGINSISIVLLILYLLIDSGEILCWIFFSREDNTNLLKHVHAHTQIKHTQKYTHTHTHRNIHSLIGTINCSFSLRIYQIVRESAQFYHHFNSPNHSLTHLFIPESLFRKLLEASSAKLKVPP